MKALSKELKNYSISIGEFAHIKTPAIYGHYEPNTMAPLVYLKKPKWVSDEDFKKIIKSIKLEITNE